MVVSPLIALQNDQLAHLHTAGLSATVVNSQQSAAQRAAALADPGEFVFLSPEQLANAETRAALRAAQPGLFVVDEAHLVSQWGQDFRPDYLRLGQDADNLGAPTRLAFTATAAPPVRDEIVRRLGLTDPEVVIGDFDRPHIELSVEHVATPSDKQRAIARIASGLEGAGIVYAATHADAQAARDTLAAAGHDVALYHAGVAKHARGRTSRSPSAPECAATAGRGNGAALRRRPAHRPLRRARLPGPARAARDRARPPTPDLTPGIRCESV